MVELGKNFKSKGRNSSQGMNQGGISVKEVNNVPSALYGARCSSVVRAFAHGAMGRRIDPSWWTL